MTVQDQEKTSSTEVKEDEEQQAQAQAQEEEDTSSSPQQQQQPPLLSAADIAKQQKVQHWRNSPFAVGCVNPTWKDDNPFVHHDIPRDERHGCTACCCHCLGANRIGNMAVFCSSNLQDVYNNSDDDDDDNDNTTKRPSLGCVVGPYWPVNFCLTWPLILGISGWTCYKQVLGQHIAIIVTWGICTFLLILSLAKVAWSNPGILYRYSEIPTSTSTDNNNNGSQQQQQQDNSNWRWNDQARTYRPPKARFDTECQVVVDDFDHVCPWTGTAIGGGNMKWFRIFVCMVPLCIAYTVVLHVMLPAFSK